MAVTQVGTPNATVYTTSSGGASSVAWSGTQPRTAGDILVFVITAAATTSVTAPATPSGWTAGPAVGNSATAHAYTAIFWKVAAGSDAAPTTTVTFSGTGRCGFTLIELTGAETVSSPIDTTGTFASGSTAASYTGITVTGSTNVAYSGEYGIAAFAFEYTTASSTSAFAAGTGWTNFSNDSSTSSRDHNAVDHTSSAPSVGSAASDAASATSSGTTGFRAAVLATFAPPHDPGPSLTVMSPFYGVRATYRMAGQALASVIPQVAVTPPTPAPLYPLTQPVDGYRRLHRPPQGIVRGIAGAALFVSVLGPPVTPLHSPVHAARPLPPAGKVISRTGLFSGTGPAVTPLRHPVTAALRTLPPRGKVISRAGVLSGTGPALTPLRTPVKARQPLPPRGVKHARTGTYSGTGPAVTPLHQPAQPAVRPLPRRGTVASRTGTFSGLGPQVTPLRQPVRAVPVRLPSGRAITLRIVQVTSPVTGPPLTPLHQPVRATLPAPRQRGHYEALTGLYSGHGPALRPLTAPVRARLRPPTPPGQAFAFTYLPPTSGPAAPPLSQPRGVRVTFVRGGHVQSSPLTAPFIPASGPKLYPLHTPVRAALPAPHQHGHAEGLNGVYSGEGPAVRPLTAPVRARQPLPPQGRVLGIYRPAALLPAPTPAPLYPLRQPVQARRPLPAPGRAASMAVLTVTLTNSGPVIPPRAQPIRATIPALSRGSRVLGVYRAAAVVPIPTTGPPIPPRTQPIRAVLPFPVLKGRSFTVSPPALTAAAQLAPLSQPPGIRVSFLRTGHVQSFRGAPPPSAPSTGPVIPPRAQPWRSPILRGIRGGIAQSRTGLFSGTGPAVRALAHPVRASLPLQPVLTGRAATMAMLAVTLPAPAVAPAPPRGVPVRAVLPAPSLRGYVRNTAGTYAGEGPVVRPLTGPLQARRPLPPQGRALGAHQGVYSGKGPAVRPLAAPVRARQPLPPAGRVLGIVRVIAQVPAPVAGPPLYPLHQPIRGRLPLPGPGRAATMSVLEFTPGTVSLAPIQPRAMPWRAVIPAPARGGYTYSRTGTFSGTGPALALLHHPVRTLPVPSRRGQVLTTPVHAATVPVQPRSQPWRAVLPAQPRPGYIRSSRVTSSGQTPGPAPLHTPVRARQPQPLRGQVLGVTRTVAVPPVPITGPPVYPLRQPVRARQPLPPRGRVLGAYQVVVLPPTPTIGPRIPPRAQPWRAVLPAPHQRGAASTFVPPPPPTAPPAGVLFGPRASNGSGPGGARLPRGNGAPPGSSRNQP